VTADPLAYLFSLEQFGIKLGLDNIRALLEALGNPERAFTSVHIAGTNGKGSVTAMVDSALRAAGRRSARYTSPHLIDLTERFVVNGKPVTHEALIAAVGHVRDVAAGLQSSGRMEVHPTFFEVTTAVAFDLFRDAGVEIAVCEVGLGGRLDATNVLAPSVTAITSIAYDHQQYLGDTLAEIACEKAGIIKPGVPIVVGDLDPSADEVIAAVAREREATLVRAHEGVAVHRRTTPDGRQTMRLRTPAHDYGHVELAFAGAHQVHNAVVAVRIIEQLFTRGVNVPPPAVVEGLASVRWPGRLDRRTLSDGREALLDAAHNPAGAAALASYLVERGEKPPMVFAAMRDKDTSGMLRALTPAVSAVVVTRTSNPRSADPIALADAVRAIAPGLPVVAHDSPTDALAAAWALAPRIVVAGSIFLLGDVLKELNGS
jgi:dihydrofolate synthase/folylpolyglutamate synthase